MAGYQGALLLQRLLRNLYQSLALRKRLKILSLLFFGSLLGVWLTVGWAIGEQSPELIDLRVVAPAIQLELRYATTNNFTHQKLYDQALCLLRPHVAARLAKVQTDLEAKGFGLKVFDCYRPLSVQKRMWELVPNANYVADPKLGSRHNRGSAVDVTLVDRTGKELPMPSTFDEFSPRSHLDYRGGNPAAIRHREVLQQAMLKRGFTSIPSEWWHFDAPNWQAYPLLDLPLNPGTALH